MLYSAFWLIVIAVDYNCSVEVLAGAPEDAWCNTKRLSSWFKSSGNYTMPTLTADTFCRPLKAMTWGELQYYHNLKDAAALSGWTEETWKTYSNEIREYQWSDLTSDEQAGEAVLGMTELSWDYCIDDVCIPCEDEAAAAAAEAADGPPSSTYVPRSG